MPNKSPESPAPRSPTCSLEMIPHKRIHKVYALSILLAAFLFAFHACVLILMSSLSVRATPDLIPILGHHLAGIAIVFAAFLILFVTHMLEAWAWGFFFLHMGEMPNLEKSVYFAGTSLTALGYGDVVLKAPWQRLGPVMATNGILMYGCSTAFLFLVIQKIWQENTSLIP